MGVTPDIRAVILAAGRSNRMGRPKQLLELNGETLLGHVIRCAHESLCRAVIVVLGASAVEIGHEIRDLPCEVVLNPDWEEGISSSIRRAAQWLQDRAPQLDGVLFLTCDQPWVTNQTIDELVRSFAESDRPIVASSYGKTLGVPALFDKVLFGELAGLKGDFGAKSVIESDLSRVLAVPCPEAALDIDTPRDWEQARSEGNTG